MIKILLAEFLGVPVLPIILFLIAYFGYALYCYKSRPLK